MYVYFFSISLLDEWNPSLNSTTRLIRGTLILQDRLNLLAMMKIVPQNLLFIYHLVCWINRNLKWVIQPLNLLKNKTEVFSPSPTLFKAIQYLTVDLRKLYAKSFDIFILIVSKISLCNLVTFLINAIVLKHFFLFAYTAFSKAFAIQFHLSIFKSWETESSQRPRFTFVILLGICTMLCKNTLATTAT